jgi:hypothetical protein
MSCNGAIDPGFQSPDESHNIFVLWLSDFQVCVRACVCVCVCVLGGGGTFEDVCRNQYMYKRGRKEDVNKETKEQPSALQTCRGRSVTGYKVENSSDRRGYTMVINKAKDGHPCTS